MGGLPDMSKLGLSPQLSVLLLLTLLSLLPAIILTMTSFTRFIIVLSFVRQGIGSQQSPPTQVLVGLAASIRTFGIGKLIGVSLA